MQGGQVFVYGTLMADEVVGLLLKRVPPSKPATLAGHRRHAVKGQVFPAIVPADAGSSVRGKVLLQLSPRELEILDVYEAEEYYRARVQPSLDDGTRVDADVYVWKDQYRHLLGGDWSYEGWREDHFAAWMRRMDPSGGHPNGQLAAE
ncbi:hypothetical protein Rsub_01368 [Raphidocelis subcapitata]|uniref:Putative gamma-glutamylcyclotransferase n=1 Tax=Raphidocelis subcapitata TaxID=307507 RepID=A0A2V0NNQ9_9CHLO|nr:hypothetical protein Rsub_01368 [Raphidocelis subcapitata]|eukprot:GBF88869.1 hypothetical protein Rsub_01368 [Raphidocelis subcapitata]